MVNITHLVTQDNAESGVWAQVEIRGQKLDFELKILGDDSNAVQKLMRTRVKKMRHNSEKELNDETIDFALGFGSDGIVVRMAGIRGLQFDEEHKEILEYVPVLIEYEDKKTKEKKEKELKDDEESYLFLIEKIPDIKDFVLKFSKDRTNFLSGKPNS
jgi:hypothetical protein